MKKISIMALTLGLFLSAGNALAADGVLQDSVWLGKDDVLSKDVGQPNSGAALGSVIVWTNAGMPADEVNWQECAGQSLAGTEVCKWIGICTAPDYRGQFLRGIVGKAGALGQKQQAAIPQNLGKGYYNNILSATPMPGASGSLGARWNAYYAVKWGNNSNTANVSIDMDIAKGTDIQRADELRPENTGVRYLIKVN